MNEEMNEVGRWRFLAFRTQGPNECTDDLGEVGGPSHSPLSAILAVENMETKNKTNIAFRIILEFRNPIKFLASIYLWTKKFENLTDVWFHSAQYTSPFLFPLHVFPYFCRALIIFS